MILFSYLISLGYKPNGMLNYFCNSLFFFSSIFYDEKINNLVVE
jgi:hypothetical protein